MKKIILLPLLICFVTIGFSQKKTKKIFYKEKGEETDSINAIKYTIYIYKDSIKGSGTVKNYTINGRLTGETEYANIDANYQPIKRWTRDGISKEYDENENLITLKTYKMNKWNGELITYYPSGKLRRSDFFKDDKLVSGKCFAEDGTEIEYFDYKIVPQYEGGDKAIGILLPKI